MDKLTAADPETRSPDLAADNVAQLKALFPSAFAGGELDFDALRQLLGADDDDESPEKYGLSWHGKGQARRVALAPSAATLRPCPQDSRHWDTTQNLFLEGDNLEILKLLQKSYAGQVKLIYIDPPYNTGKDRIYPDDYQDGIGNYLRLTGQTDDQGHKVSTNPESSGRFHTHWLNMIYPRLKVARNLLREDGVILVSIDDNEQQHLRTIVDEVFGSENFLANIAVVSNLAGSSDQFGFAGAHEYCLAYAKSRSEVSLGRFRLSQSALADWEQDELGYYKPERLHRGSLTYSQSLDYPIFVGPNDNIEVTDDDKEPAENGPFTAVHPVMSGRNGIWRWSKTRIRENPGDVFAERRKDGSIVIYSKQRPQLGDLPSEKPKSVFYKPAYSSRAGGETISQLFPEGKQVFSYPKALELIKDFLRIGAADPDSIVLDFFAGSGTTGHAVMLQNAEDGGHRRYILVQLPELLDPADKDQRVAANFCDSIGKPRNLAELTKERLRRAAGKIKSSTPPPPPPHFRVDRYRLSGFPAGQFQH